jgi:hypothetical protein
VEDFGLSFCRDIGIWKWLLLLAKEKRKKKKEKRGQTLN